MERAFAECARLIRVGAVHRKGFKVSETTHETQCKHAIDEVRELVHAHDRSERLKELGDVFGCLIQVAIRNGFTPAEVETQILAKWSERFADAGWEIVFDNDGQMARMRWSVPDDHGRHFYCRHYPATQWGLSAIEQECKRFNDERRTPDGVRANIYAGRHRTGWRPGE